MDTKQPEDNFGSFSPEAMDLIRLLIAITPFSYPFGVVNKWCDKNVAGDLLTCAGNHVEMFCLLAIIAIVLIDRAFMANFIIKKNTILQKAGINVGRFERRALEIISVGVQLYIFYRISDNLTKPWISACILSIYFVSSAILFSIHLRREFFFGIDTPYRTKSPMSKRESNCVGFLIPSIYIIILCDITASIASLMFSFHYRSIYHFKNGSGDPAFYANTASYVILGFVCTLVLFNMFIRHRAKKLVIIENKQRPESD